MGIAPHAWRALSGVGNTPLFKPSEQETIVHTAVQLKTSRFAIRIGGAESQFSDLFPEWTKTDRLGVVVRSPLEGLGASLAIQLAIAAFYEADAGRPGHVYPEVYVFHVGGNKSSYAWFDIFPPRKEVEVADEPAALLDAINDRGITRLLVPDVLAVPYRAHHQEPATALDRIVSALAYSASSQTDRGDVEIEALNPDIDQNLRIILDSDSTLELQNYLFNVIPEVLNSEEAIPPDLPEVPAETREAISAHRALFARNGLSVETYRRIAVADAVAMLGIVETAA